MTYDFLLLLLLVAAVGFGVAVVTVISLAFAVARYLDSIPLQAVQSHPRGLEIASTAESAVAADAADTLTALERHLVEMPARAHASNDSLVQPKLSRRGCTLCQRLKSAVGFFYTRSKAR
jgi:hypothetical protein